MTTVAQLIERLKQFPPDAEVESLAEICRFHEIVSEWRPVDIDKIRMASFDTPMWADNKHLFGRKIVFIFADSK